MKFTFGAMERGEYKVAHFDPKRDRSFHLAIVLGQGPSACVAHDLETGEPQLLVWAPGVEALTSASVPLQPRSVTYVALPEWSTLVPDGALDPSKSVEHLTLVHGKLPFAQVRDEPVKTLSATCLFAHDETNERAVLDRFPNARALPLQAVLVRGAQMRSTTSPVLLMHRGADRVDLTVANGQRLLLSNSYLARTAEDVLYFCLLAAEKAGIPPAEVKLRSGGTHLLQLERDLLDRYFSDHAPAVPSTWPNIPKALGPVDRWLAAFDQFACVS